MVFTKNIHDIDDIAVSLDFKLHFQLIKYYEYYLTTNTPLIHIHFKYPKKDCPPQKVPVFNQFIQMTYTVNTSMKEFNPTR